MKKDNNENLNELMAQFLGDEDASKAAADIAAGERILTANPAPTPSPALLVDIRRQMTAANARHRRARYFTRRIAAAAVILLVLAIGSTMLQRHGTQLASEAFWQDTPEISLDAQLTQLDETDIDAPVLTLEVSGNDMPAMNDLTDELDDIQGTFWEG